MSATRQQALGIIETCKTAVATVAKQPQLIMADNSTIEVATAILEQAKKEVTSDPVLASVSLAPPVTWTGLLSAMETVVRSLPLNRPSAQFASRRGI